MLTITEKDFRNAYETLESNEKRNIPKHVGTVYAAPLPMTGPHQAELAIKRKSYEEWVELLTVHEIAYDVHGKEINGKQVR